MAVAKTSLNFYVYLAIVNDMDKPNTPNHNNLCCALTPLSCVRYVTSEHVSDVTMHKTIGLSRNTILNVLPTTQDGTQKIIE